MSLWRELGELGGAMPPMPLDEETTAERINERRELPHSKLYSRLAMGLVTLNIITNRNAHYQDSHSFSHSSSLLGLSLRTSLSILR